MYKTANLRLLCRILGMQKTAADASKISLRTQGAGIGDSVDNVAGDPNSYYGKLEDRIAHSPTKLLDNHGQSLQWPGSALKGQLAKNRPFGPVTLTEHSGARSLLADQATKGMYSRGSVPYNTWTDFLRFMVGPTKEQHWKETGTLPTFTREQYIKMMTPEQKKLWDNMTPEQQEWQLNYGNNYQSSVGKPGKDIAYT